MRTYLHWVTGLQVCTLFKEQKYLVISIYSVTTYITVINYSIIVAGFICVII